MTMETPIFLCCKTQSAYSAYSHTIARVRHSVWRRKKCTSQINDQGFRRKTVSQSSKSKKSPLSQCNRMFNYMSIATSLIVYHILYIKNYILYIIYHILYIIYYILYIIYYILYIILYIYISMKRVGGSFSAFLRGWEEAPHPHPLTLTLGRASPASPT